MAEDKEKYTVISTKISPDMADVLNKVCDALQVDVYHLLQWCVYGICRAANPMHELQPDIQKLMAMMDIDAGWQNAFNLCNPDRLKVAQCILILEQEGHKGFGAVMVDRPWNGVAQQTECSDTILERVTEVTMSGIYRKIRRLGAQMRCDHLSEILLSMIDAQMLLEVEEEERKEMQGPADYSEYGRQYAYGKKTKSKHHRTPDSLANRQMRIQFDEADREAADREADGWSGEHRQTEAPPEDMQPFDQEW